MSNLNRHVTQTGPNAGQLVPCHAKKCRNKSVHIDESVVRAARGWKEAASDGSVTLSSLRVSDVEAFEKLPSAYQDSWKRKTAGELPADQQKIGQKVNYSDAEKQESYNVYASAMRTLHYGSDIDDDDYDESEQFRIGGAFLKVWDENPNSKLNPSVKELVLDAMEIANSGRGADERNKVMMKISNQFQDVQKGLSLGTTEAEYEKFKSALRNNALKDPKERKSFRDRVRSIF